MDQHGSCSIPCNFPILTLVMMMSLEVKIAKHRPSQGKNRTAASLQWDSSRVWQPQTSHFSLYRIPMFDWFFRFCLLIGSFKIDHIGSCFYLTIKHGWDGYSNNSCNQISFILHLGREWWVLEMIGDGKSPIWFNDCPSYKPPFLVFHCYFWLADGGS